MKKRLLRLGLVVLTILMLSTDGHCEEISVPPPSEEAKPAETPAPQPALLMSLLGKAGLAAPLDKAGINVYGYGEGGYVGYGGPDKEISCRRDF